MTVHRESELYQLLPGRYEQIGQSVGHLVDEKNTAYGDAFAKADDFLACLYPFGIRPDQYGDLLAIVRVFDKLMRIATDKDAMGENPWQDIAGYGILMCGTKPGSGGASENKG